MSASVCSLTYAYGVIITTGKLKPDTFEDKQLLCRETISPKWIVSPNGNPVFQNPSSSSNILTLPLVRFRQ